MRVAPTERSPGEPATTISRAGDGPSVLWLRCSGPWAAIDTSGAVNP